MIGNGLGIIGVYEFGVWSSQGSIVTPALAKPQTHNTMPMLDLKGSWGAVTLGSQWAPLAGAIGNLWTSPTILVDRGL